MPEVTSHPSPAYRHNYLKHAPGFTGSHQPILSTSNMGQDFPIFGINNHFRSKNRKFQLQFKFFVYAALIFLIYKVFHHRRSYKLHYDTFPKNFKWGIATSSYQVEGAWNESGKAPSIWDEFTKNKDNIEDGSNGDVSCDSYHKIVEDIQLLRQMKVDFYRFSLSWPRLIPDCDEKGIFNEKAVEYYNRLITILLSHNIEPVITLYHWDLPLKIEEEYGGWRNVSTSDRFEEYSDFAFKTFGDRVKRWITFNEPRETTLGGYESGYMAPGLQFEGTGTYNTTVTVLLAHAKAFRVYDAKYRMSQRGKVGITLNCDWGEAKDQSPENLSAQTRYMQWYIGIFAHPIFLGDFPKVIKDMVEKKSKEQKYRKSRLPRLSSEDVALIKGTADFLGLNHYTTRMVEAASQHMGNMVEEIEHEYTGNYHDDSDVHAYADPSWPKTGASWLQIVPWGFQKLLIWIHNEYPEIESIWITENGVSERLPKNTINLCDEQRIFYHKTYINEMMQAVLKHGVPVHAYTSWSLMDNFEWSRGYQERFGLYWVNFNSENRDRIPKASSYFYKHLIEANGFPNAYEVKKWEDRALDECKTYTAMAVASFQERVGFSFFVLFSSIFIVLVLC